jgi:hypothetical protein
MGTLAKLWGLQRRPMPAAVREFASTTEAHREGGWLSRLELVFLHTARAGAPPVRRFLEASYGAELRNEYNSQPPQHRFEYDEIKYWIDWLSRLIPNSGRALAANFLIQWHDIGYSKRPVRVVTLVRHPIARLAGEFLAFRREIDVRGGADAKTREIAGDILRFADTMMRNDYLTRFFSGVDLCDPVGDADADRARHALARIDVVGWHEQPQPFARRVLSLDVFNAEVDTAARKVFAAEMSQPFRGPGDEFATQLDSDTRRQLEGRNAYDLSLYHWIVAELAHD